MNDAVTVSVSEARLQRILDVLALVVLGDYEPQQVEIAIPERPDAFAHLEETINVLARELAEARAENEAYVRRLQDSEAALAQKLATIEQQRAAIVELSTPIIEIWEDVLVLPVVGTVDTRRSADMTERLLARIVEKESKSVIIDVTGVDVVDTMTADHFVRMIKATRLLGCHCVVTGVSPEVAHTLVRLGVNLGRVQTLRSLKDGLKACLRHLRAHADGARRPREDA
jgi:rsbT co-antagonist protein RsbR